MKNRPIPPIEDLTAAMQRGVDTARSIHAALGLPVAVWRAGRVQLIDAATLQPVAWPDAVRESLGSTLRSTTERASARRKRRGR